MKGSSILILVVLIAGFLTIFADFNRGLNDSYSENYVNSSEWDSKYDFSNNINGSVSNLKSNFDTITDTEKSWFTRIGAGIVAIPYAVILFPLTIFDGFASFGSILTDLSSDFGVKGKLIGLGLILLIIFAVTKLLEFFQRSPA